MTRVISEETRNKMSNNHADFSGKNNPNYGKKHTKEWRENHSKQMMGKNNPNFGNHTLIGDKSPRWIGDKAVKRKKYYCIEGCGNEISYSGWKHGTKKCKSCVQKGKNNHRYKKRRSNEFPK